MNFRNKILSKSSLGSSHSSSSRKTQAEELSKLQAEFNNLRHSLEGMKISLEKRDAAIGNIAREKEKLYIELKSTQRTNRNLHQQLNDERDFHSKEKEYLIEEIKKLTKINNEDNLDENIWHTDGNQSKYVEQMLKAKDEIIYDLCAKYMRIRTRKSKLQRSFEKFKEQNLRAYERIMRLIEENKQSLCSLLKRLLKSSVISPRYKKYLSLLRMNANLQFENTELKILISTLCSNNDTCEEKNFMNALNSKPLRLLPNHQTYESSYSNCCGDQNRSMRQRNALSAKLGLCRRSKRTQRIVRSTSVPCLR